MPTTLANTKTRIDNWIDSRGVLTRLIGNQENSSRNMERYWQLLRTHDLAHVPNYLASGGAGNGDAVPNNVNAIAEGETEGWLKMFPEWVSEALPAMLEVSQYGAGSNDRGWSVTIWFKWEGSLYSKIIDFGPSSGRNQPWQEE